MSGRVVLPKIDPRKDPLGQWDNAFFITINTNTNLPGLDRGLEAVWKYMMSHAGEFLVGRPGGRLIEVKQHHAIEVGKKYGKIHLHGHAVFTTTGIAFLDYFKVNEFVNRNLRQIVGFKRCNFQAKLIKNYNANRLMAEYIEKEVQKEGEEIEEEEWIGKEFNIL